MKRTYDAMSERSYYDPYRYQSRSNAIGGQGVAASNSLYDSPKPTSIWDNVIITIAEASNGRPLTFFEPDRLYPPITIPRIIEEIRKHLPHEAQALDNVSFTCVSSDGMSFEMLGPHELETMIGWKHKENNGPVTSLNLLMHCDGPDKRYYAHSSVNSSHMTIDLTNESDTMVIKEEPTYVPLGSGSSIQSTPSSTIFQDSVSWSAINKPCATGSQSVATPSNVMVMPPILNDAITHATPNVKPELYPVKNAAAKYHNRRIAHANSWPHRWSTQEHALLYTLCVLDSLELNIAATKYHELSGRRTVEAARNKIKQLRANDWKPVLIEVANLGRKKRDHKIRKSAATIVIPSQKEGAEGALDQANQDQSENDHGKAH